MYCLINEQECFIRFKATSAQIQWIYCLISILYIKNTNEDTTTIDTALMPYSILYIMNAN
jgi:hypothetical protein